jgi:hypothetical protein
MADGTIVCHPEQRAKIASNQRKLFGAALKNDKRILKNHHHEH